MSNREVTDMSKVNGLLSGEVKTWCLVFTTSFFAQKQAAFIKTKKNS